MTTSRPASSGTTASNAPASFIESRSDPMSGYTRTLLECNRLSSFIASELSALYDGRRKVDSDIPSQAVFDARGALASIAWHMVAPCPCQVCFRTSTTLGWPELHDIIRLQPPSAVQPKMPLAAEPEEAQSFGSTPSGSALTSPSETAWLSGTSPAHPLFLGNAPPAVVLGTPEALRPPIATETTENDTEEWPAAPAAPASHEETGVDIDDPARNEAHQTYSGPTHSWSRASGSITKPIWAPPPLAKSDNDDDSTFLPIRRDSTVSSPIHALGPDPLEDPVVTNVPSPSEGEAPPLPKLVLDVPEERRGSFSLSADAPPFEIQQPPASQGTGAMAATPPPDGNWSNPIVVHPHSAVSGASLGFGGHNGGVRLLGGPFGASAYHSAYHKYGGWKGGGHSLTPPLAAYYDPEQLACPGELECANPECPFVHGVFEPLQAARFLRMTAEELGGRTPGVVACRYGTLGRCTRGLTCMYRHYEPSTVKPLSKRQMLKMCQIITPPTVIPKLANTHNTGITTATAARANNVHNTPTGTRITTRVFTTKPAK